MDYFKIYCDLINKRLQEPAFIDETGLGEIHHIIPRKLENNNIIIDLFNNYNIGQLVNLTYREHYIAHKLLVSVFKKDVKKYKDIYYKMVYAFNILTNDGKHITTSKDYEMLRKHFIEAIGIKIECYDLNGNLVKRYESTLEVEKDEYCRSAVSYCCHNQYHKKKCVYKGLIWRFEYDKDSIFDIIKDIDETFVINTNNTTRKPVLCYTLDGELVKEYRSLTSAEKDGFNGHIVSKCCNNEYGELKDVYKNFRWKWKL